MLVIALMLSACEEKLKPAVVLNFDPNGTPTQESWKATVFFSDSGKTLAKLQAGYIAVYSDKQYTLLEDSIKVDFYDDYGRHTSTLTALRGKIDDRTHDMEAYDRVVIVSDSGTVLRTEKILWVNQTKHVKSDQYVTITSPNEQIQGYGFDSDQNLKNYTIFKVTGTAKPQE
jgi:LPS export ABC transporter protein LptC